MITKLNFAVLSATLAALALFGGAEPVARPEPAITLPCKVVSVHDGDSLTAVVTMQMQIRLLDCWAPEVTGAEKPKGLVSAEKLRSMADGKTGTLTIPLHDSLQKSLTFGRVLGRIHIDGQDKDLSTQMVEGGWATKSKQKQASE